jgi:hypothetical protein
MIRARQRKETSSLSWRVDYDYRGFVGVLVIWLRWRDGEDGEVGNGSKDCYLEGEG